VGDSLGTTALGFDTTLPVTMAMMIHHCSAVRRGVQRAFVICDMPFMSYKISNEQALRKAAELVQLGGAEAVKLEGGQEIAPVVERIVKTGIPVMGHVGLIPQSVHQLGGYRVQGRQEENAAQLVADAQALERAGAFSIVLEGMAPAVAQQITEQLQVPTIGIGAGSHCGGQVLVMADLVGLTTGVPPKFVKRYANVHETMLTAVREYAQEVQQGKFPDPQHEY
jgi:3-methyl-2-oxobutanoate hydroxymethyltransferase